MSQNRLVARRPEFEETLLYSSLGRQRTERQVHAGFGGGRLQLGEALGVKIVTLFLVVGAARAVVITIALTLSDSARLSISKAIYMESAPSWTCGST